MKKTICQSNSAKETAQIAEQLAKKIRPGQVLALWGNLGSGKTTFAKGFAKGLKIKRVVKSPSFLIFKTYPLKQGYFVHADLYRLRSFKEAGATGLFDFINNKNIVLIEWPEKIKKNLPKKRTDIFFKIIEKGKREITLIHF